MNNAVPGDTRVNTKEDKKSKKYRNLCRELGRLLRIRCGLVPIIVGSHLKMLHINLLIETIQKSAILETENFEKGFESKRTEDALGILWLQDAICP